MFILTPQNCTQPEDLHVPIPLSTPSPTPRPTSQLADERERPQAYPSCYNNLMAGRTTGQLSSTSPGQGAAPGKYKKKNNLIIISIHAIIKFICFKSGYR